MEIRYGRPTMVIRICLILITLTALTLALDTTLAHHSTNERGGIACVQIASTVTGNTNRFIRIDTGGGLEPTCASACDGLGDCPVEFDPGETITLTYRETTEGASPPEAPDNIIIRVVLDDEDDQGTNQIIELHNGAPPADGSTFTFDATHTGLATGTPSAGTLRLYVRAAHDNVVDALDYTCSSDGEASTGVSRSCSQQRAGYVRSCMDVTAFTATSPPSGAKFAYGPAGDEQVTTTVTYTRPYRQLSHQDIRLDINRDTDSSVVITGTLTDADTGGQRQETHTIDLTFDANEVDYGSEFIVDGLSPMVLGGFTWTIMCDPITDGTRVSDVLVEHTSLFTADPRIELCEFTGPTFCSFGLENNRITTDHDVYNRGETVTYEFTIVNSRTQLLTRSMTVEVRSNDSTLVDSQIVSGQTYSSSYVIAATDPAASNVIGNIHSFRVTNTDQTKDSEPAHGVSSKYFVDAHVQKDNTLVKDDWPTENVTEDLQFISGEDIIHVWCHVRGVRLDRNIDTGATQVVIEIRDDVGDVQATATKQTGADGWTVSTTSTAAVPPLGAWEAECDVGPHQGNSGLTIQTVAVGSAFTGDKIIKIFVKQVMNDGVTYRVYISPQVNFAPVEPDSVPVIRISFIDHSQMPEVFLIDVDIDDMVSAASDLPEVNGTLYYHEFTPDINKSQMFGNEDAVLFATHVSAVVNGTVIQNSQTFEVQSVIEISGYDSSALLEFAIWAGITLFAMHWQLNWLGLIGIIGFLRPILTDQHPMSFTFLIMLAMLVLAIEYVVRNRLIPGLEWGDQHRRDRVE